MLLQYFESTLGLTAGESAMFINGLQVDLDVNDAFTLVELLHSESRLMEGLHSLAQQYQLSAVITQQLLKLDLRDSETMYAVDIRDPSVIVCCCHIFTYHHHHHHHVVVVVVIAQQLFSYRQLSRLRKSATAAGLSHKSCTVSCDGWL